LRQIDLAPVRFRLARREAATALDDDAVDENFHGVNLRRARKRHLPGTAPQGDHMPAPHSSSRGSPLSLRR
jgi:hypothetical protein